MRKGLLFVFLLISINIFAFDCLNWSIKIEGDSVCCLKQEKVLSVVISDLSPADSCLYIWQELKGGQYMNISGFSGDSLVLENVESGTFCYRCIAKPNECVQDTSEIFKLIVRPDITAAEIVGQEDSICYNKAPQMFSVKIAPTCAEDDSFTYQWEESVDSIEWNAIDGAVSDKYQPEALKLDKYYRLRTTSVQGCGFRYSNVIKVCVYKDLEITTQGVSPFCYMESRELRVLATGQGEKYTYQWQYSENNVDFVDILGATNSSYYTDPKKEGMYYYKCVVTSVKCCDKDESAVIEVEVYADLTSGEIQGTDTICYNAVPEGVLSQKVEPTGGDGVYRYQWQKREKGSDIWQDIPSATNKTYQPIQLTITTDYRLGVIDECDTVYTDSVRITVRPEITAAEIQGQVDTICYKAEPSEFSVKTYPTGGDDDKFTYQWEESVDSIEWNAIDGAVLDKYQPEALVADRYYRLRTTSVQGCGVRYSNVIKVCVYSDLEITEYSSSLCYMKQGEIRVSATGQGGLYTYQWYYLGNNIDFVEIEGATSATYRTESKTEGTYYYKCKVTPIKGCLAKESDVIVVNVYADVEPAVIGVEEQEVCYGEDATALNIEQSAKGGDGSYIYLWQKSIDKEKWEDLEVATSYLPQKMTETTYYRLKIKTTCKEVYSNVVVVIVNPLPDVQNIEGSSDVCYNQYEYYFIDEIKDGFTYKWYLSDLGGKIVSSYIDVDSIEVLWEEKNITNNVMLEIVNNETGCVRVNKISVNVCGEKAPNRTIIVRKPNSNILVAQENDDIYYVWGYTEKATGESSYIEDSNRRYVLLPHAYDTMKYDYWLRLQPSESSKCYSVSYYTPENDEVYINQKSNVNIAYVKENILIKIDNPEEHRVQCYLYSVVGQLVDYIDLGGEININRNISIAPNNAMYILKVELGNEVLTFKVIAE